MDESTTDAEMQETQALDAEPVEQPAEAEYTATEESTQTDEEQEVDDEAPAETDNAEVDLTEWAAKKGIDLSTPEGQAKALKSMREADKAINASRQELSSLKKSIQGQTATTSDDKVRKLELSLQAQTWKEDRGITREQDAVMGEYLNENPQKLALLNYGLLDLDDVLTMSGAGKVDVQAVKSQGGKEALQQLANKMAVTAPRGNASAASKKTASDPIMDLLRAD